MGAAVGLSTLSVCGAGKAGLYLETQVQLLILGGFAQSSPVAFTPSAGFLHPDTPLTPLFHLSRRAGLGVRSESAFPT